MSEHARHTSKEYRGPHLVHVEHVPGTCPCGKSGGIDGRGLFLLAWCECGWNRTRATRSRAREALTGHYQGRAIR